MKIILRWQCGRVLGVGSFGKVLYGFNTETGQVMAVKQVSISEFRTSEISDKIKELEQEIEILQPLQHKNIVRYFGTTRDTQYFNIFLEYEAGNLYSILRWVYSSITKKVWSV